MWSKCRLTGATIFPVCPTCMSLGTNPASTAALDAPTVGEKRGAHIKVRGYVLHEQQPIDCRPEGYIQHSDRRRMPFDGIF